MDWHWYLFCNRLLNLIKQQKKNSVFLYFPLNSLLHSIERYRETHQRNKCDYSVDKCLAFKMMCHRMGLIDFTPLFAIKIWPLVMRAIFPQPSSTITVCAIWSWRLFHMLQQHSSVKQNGHQNQFCRPILHIKPDFGSYHATSEICKKNQYCCKLKKSDPHLFTWDSRPNLFQGPDMKVNCLFFIRCTMIYLSALYLWKQAALEIATSTWSIAWLPISKFP